MKEEYDVVRELNGSKEYLFQDECTNISRYSRVNKNNKYYGL